MPETKPIYNEIKQDEPLPEPQKTSETILNPNIIGGNLTIGSGNDVFKANAKGICLGNQVFENAPFRVDMNGMVWGSNRIAVVSNFQLDGTTTGTDIILVKIKNLLSVNNSIRIKLFLSMMTTLTSSATITFQLIYGGTIIASRDLTFLSNNLNWPGILEAAISWNGSTSAQMVYMNIMQSQATDGTNLKYVGLNSFNNASIISTDDLWFQVRVITSQYWGTLYVSTGYMEKIV